MTKQRRVVLEEVRRLPGHPTADEVHEAVKRHMPRVSLGTVYRNLDVLSRSGEILRIDVPGSQRRYDDDLSTHFHVHCARCGRVDDVRGPRPDVDLGAYSGLEGYRVLDHRLEFAGVCDACRARDNDSCHDDRPQALCRGAVSDSGGERKGNRNGGRQA